MSRAPLTFVSTTFLAALCLLVVALPAHGQWTNQSDLNTVVSTATDNVNTTQIVAGGSNGSFVLWSTLWGTGKVYLQYVDDAGLRPNSDLQVSSAGYDPVMVSDGSGGVIVAWRDSNSRMRAQRFDSTLTPQWFSPIYLHTSGQASEPAITTDGSGGAIVSWTHRASSGAQPDIHAQHVASNGAQQWSVSTGFVVVAQPSQQRYSAIAPGGNGGDAFVVWEDTRAGLSNRDIWVRYIDSSGTGTWSFDLPVVNASDDQWRPKVIADGSGGFVTAWQDDRNGMGELFAQRIDSVGLHLWAPWNGIAIDDRMDSLGFDIGPDGTGGAVLTWSGSTASTAGDIHFQQVDGTGLKQWGTGGLAITSGASNTNERVLPSLASDGAGGAVVTWGTVSQTNSNFGDIYAQYIDPGTGASWVAGGLLVSDAPDMQSIPDVAADSECPAKITWRDYRDDGDVYIQRIKCPGILGKIIPGGGVLIGLEHAHDFELQSVNEIRITTGTVDDLELVDHVSDASFELVYDPNVIRVRELLSGTLDGLEMEIDGEAGIVRVHAAGGESAPGSTLFSLAVEAVGEGSSALSFTGAAAGEDVFLATMASVVTVGGGEAR